MIRAILLASIPHTHRNRFLPIEQRGLLIVCHERKTHRDAERAIKGFA